MRFLINKLHHFIVLQPIKPEKDNAYDVSQYNDIQNVRQYLVYIAQSSCVSLKSHKHVECFFPHKTFAKLTQKYRYLIV